MKRYLRSYFHLTSYDRFTSHKALFGGLWHVRVDIYAQRIQSLFVFFFCISFARLSRPAVNIVEQIHFYLNRWGMCRETNLNHNVCTIEIKGTKPTMSEDRLNWAIWFDSSFFLLRIFLHLLSAQWCSISDVQIKNRNKDTKHNNNNKMKWSNHITRVNHQS